MEGTSFKEGEGFFIFIYFFVEDPPHWLKRKREFIDEGS